jgi:hypothetical protein
MPSPFHINPNNFNISKEERKIKKKIFDKLLLKNRDSDCISSDISSVNNYSELLDYVGKLDLYLLLNQLVSKISSFSPVNFNDFIQNIDETTMLLSCLWPENADKINNKTNKEQNFDLGLELESLFLDFYKFYRDSIRQFLENIVFQIIQKYFLQILDFIDCNKINKCVIPCSPENNPYKNLFASIKIKEGKNTELFLLNKIKQEDLSISQQDLKKIYQSSLSLLVPEQIDCLFNGFISSDIIKALMDLFNSQSSEQVNETKIINIFKDTDQIIEIVPGLSDLLPATPCGQISLEGVARLKLKNEGKTPEEIDNIIQTTINESNGKLQEIARILNNVKFDLIDLNLIQNSPITNTLLLKGIDSLFNSLNGVQKTTESIFKNILLNPYGDLICAFYFLESPGAKIAFNLSDSIDKTLNLQVDQFNQNIFDDPISLFLVGTENFNSRYLSGFERLSKFTFKYLNDNSIDILSDNELIFKISKTSISDQINQINIPYEFPEINDYVGLTQRNDTTLIFKEQNNILLQNYFNIDEESTAKTIYDFFTNYIDSDIGRTFYFQEYNQNNSKENKINFSKLDYFNFEKEKQDLKDKLGIR